MFWVVGTWLIGVIVVNTATRSGAGQLARQIRSTVEGQLIGELAAFMFHIGFPFVAVIVGVLGLDVMALGNAQPSALLGFAALEWVRGVGIAIGIVLFVVLVLWLMTCRIPMRRVPMRRVETQSESTKIVPLATWSTALRDAAYAEVHWTFYRSAGALWFGDLYAGAVLGCVLIGLEWAVQPGFRAQIQSAEMRPQLVLKLICLIVSSGLYLGTQNLWLMMAAHILILMVGSRFLNAQTGATQTTNATPSGSS